MLLHVRTVSITPAGTPTTPSAPASEPAPVVVAPAPAPAPKLKKRQKSILPGDISATAVAAADARKAKADAVMRQRTATEMLQTEDSYIKCLRVLVEVREHLKSRHEESGELVLRRFLQRYCVMLIGAGLPAAAGGQQPADPGRAGSRHGQRARTARAARTLRRTPASACRRLDRRGHRRRHLH